MSLLASSRAYRAAPAFRASRCDIVIRKSALPWLAISSRRSLATQTEEPLRKTPLHDFHVEHAAKMVPFGGYSMPLSYGDVGQVASHKHVRNSAGLFDVSHMVQTNFRGPSCTSFMEWITPSGLDALQPYHSTLSVLTNEKGGIIDDLMITKHSPTAYYTVTNASRRDRDLSWFREKVEEWNKGRGKSGPVEMDVLDGWGLLALQGPEAASYLQTLTSFELRQLKFGTSAFVPIEGFNLHVARGGYTGEDGFEISIPPSQVVDVTKLLVKPPVQLAGLGARDTLRIEAGMCLYGNELTEEIGPIEASLTWVIPKYRRAKGGYIGADNVEIMLKNSQSKRRVGLIVDDVPARQGAHVIEPQEKRLIGQITSGIPSPTLGKNIAMAYVDKQFQAKGTSLEVVVRGKARRAVVTPMPFVPAKYYRG